MRAPSQTCNDAAPDDAHETVFEPSDVNGLAVLDGMGIQLAAEQVEFFQRRQQGFERGKPL